MKSKLFDEKKFERLNDPQRLFLLPPALIREKAGLEKVSTVIDIGAGTGFFSREFAKLYANATVFAADISSFMVKYIKDNITPEYPNVIALQMSDAHVPLDDGNADLIIMINLHHEIKDPDAMLKECFRLLRPGGRIVISDWKKVETERGPAPESRYETQQVEQQLLSRGFSDIQSDDGLEQNFLTYATRP
jgi:ubiquinone/menaquinone biosynthesis C-methylase UbiE